MANEKPGTPVTKPIRSVLDDDDEIPSFDQQPEESQRGKRGLFAAVKSLWKRGAEDQPEIPDGPMEGEEDHWVELSLEQVLENDPDALLHVISLRGFAAALGPMWEKVGPKAMMIAESTVRFQAGSSAQIRLHGKDTFLVLFPHLSPESGRRKAFDISVALGKKLVGSKFQIVGSGGALGIGLVSLPGSILLDEGGDLSDKVLEEASEAAPQVADGVDAGVWLETEGKTQIDPSLLDGDGKADLEAMQGWLKFKVQQQKREIKLVPLEAPKRRKAAEPEWVPIRKRDG